MQKKDPEELIKNTRILVTGGAGFIGSHLVDKLLLNNEVIILDNFQTGKLKNLDKRNKKIKVMRGDVKDYELVRRCAYDVEYIFHFAATVGVARASTQQIEVLDTELSGISNILSTAVENSVKRVIYASSSEAYGNSFDLPYKENSLPTPCSVYGTAKNTAELYCKAYSNEYELETVCLRYFNIYGPRQDERFVISRFIKSVLSNAPITVYYDGKATRDFTYIDDAVQATILAAASQKTSGETINVGTGKESEIRELAQQVAELMRGGEIVYTTPSEPRLPEFEVKDRCSDISKMIKILNYQPETSFREGLIRTIDWIKENL
ncbi:NAD-dependent epimerase/dehydratase family protein [Chloroflexota bacterium]